ncbi:MAG TPA: PDZ domain-containing protein [Longimicrobiales bacterium]|nr:PDZ domain-containing protein [Longimicrobiales bacterium]
MSNHAPRAIMIALGLLLAGLAVPAAAQDERPLGEEVERAGEPPHERFLYRTRMRTPCARMGISFRGDDTIRVHRVLPGSGADEAGVRAGDVIVSVDGERANQRTMAELSENLEAGDRVRLVVRRGDRNQTIDVIAREDVCPYRTMLSHAPWRAMCAKIDSTRTDDLVECEGVTFFDLRHELEGMHEHLEAMRHQMPRIYTEHADSGVWLRFRGHEGPGDSVFIDLDSVRIMSDAVAMHLDSLSGMIPFAFSMADSIAHYFPRIRMELEEGLEGIHAGGLMLRSMELGARALAGAQLTTLNPDLGEYFETDRGVLVTNVEDGTPAARAGLEAGDVIIAVNGTEVDDLRDVRRQAAAAEETIELTILRRGERRTIELDR